MNCLKAFGERIAARDPDRQTAEIQIRIAIMNKYNALGTAEIKALARNAGQAQQVGQALLGLQTIGATTPIGTAVQLQAGKSGDGSDP